MVEMVRGELGEVVEVYIGSSHLLFRTCGSLRGRGRGLRGAMVGHVCHVHEVTGSCLLLDDLTEYEHTRLHEDDKAETSPCFSPGMYASSPISIRRASYLFIERICCWVKPFISRLNTEPRTHSIPMKAEMSMVL